MSKKTVSVLLLLILTIAIALFSLTSCKNDPAPAPTAAPKPGEIPPIPNNMTEINSLEEDQLSALSTLFGGFGRFFIDYYESYESDGELKPLYKLMNSPNFSLDKGINLSASASSGSFGEGENPTAYSHDEITGYIGNYEYEVSPGKKDTKICLFLDTVVTTELFEDWDEGVAVHLEYDLIEGDWLKVFIGEHENYNTPDILLDLESDHRAIESTTLGNEDDCWEMLSFLMFLGMKSMSAATIEIDNVTLTDRMLDKNDTINNDNLATFTINGLIQLNGTLWEGTKAPKDLVFDASHYSIDIEDFFSFFSVNIKTLSIQAAVATKDTFDKDTDKETVKSDLLSLNLSIENLSISEALVDDTDTTSTNKTNAARIKCDKLSLSVSNSALEAEDVVSLSLELSDLNFDSAMVTYRSISRRISRAPLLDGSFTLGFAIQAAGHSAGMVTTFDVLLGSSRIPFITIIPKSAVLDGSFYDTDEVRELLIEYCDLAIVALMSFMID